jgi:ABC-type glycerol-3-phosphate transport system substrate-binding protein
MPEGMVVFQEGWYSALSDFLTLGRFVDFQSNTCNFTCEDFYDILSFIRDFFPEEYDYSQDVAEEPLAEDAVLLEYYFNFAVEAFAQGLASYPEDVYETVGVPDMGSKIVVDYAYSIMSTSAYPQAAWDFLAAIFDQSVQVYTSFGFPVRTSVFDAQVQEAIAGGSVTQEEVDRVLDVLNGKTYLYLGNDDIMDIIYEEATACFSGAKTPEETAQIIQNRVMIYLSERE